MVEFLNAFGECRAFFRALVSIAGSWTLPLPKMRLAATLFLLALCQSGRTIDWKGDSGLDGDLLGDKPVPTLRPDSGILLQDLYAPHLRGSVPVNVTMSGKRRGSGGSNPLKRLEDAALERRQSSCLDPTFTLACPATENLPCCPPGYPICMCQPFVDSITFANYCRLP